MAGVSSEQIHVVHGRRQVPSLIGDIRPEAQAESLTQLVELESASEVSDRRYRQLSTPSSDACVAVAVSGSSGYPRQFPQEPPSGFPQVVLNRFARMAGFVCRELAMRMGSHFCLCESTCFTKSSAVCTLVLTLLAPARPIPLSTILTGALAWSMAKSVRLALCGAPVLPLVRCGECNELHLHGMDLGGRLQAIPQQEEDEFPAGSGYPRRN
jgi:hypothetical protein